MADDRLPSLFRPLFCMGTLTSVRRKVGHSVLAQSKFAQALFLIKKADAAFECVVIGWLYLSQLAAASTASRKIGGPAC